MHWPGVEMTLRLWLHLAAVLLITADKCDDMESRRLSIYGYTGNNLMNNSVNKKCSEDELTCQYAFNGRSTDNNYWEPAGPSPYVNLTHNVPWRRPFMMGRVLCKDDSCYCYINKRIKLEFDDIDRSVFEVLMTRDPFDVRNQGWLRYDFNITIPQGVMTITFPSENCKPKFIEIETHSPGQSIRMVSPTHDANCSLPDTSGTVIFTYSPVQDPKPVAFVRLSLLAPCRDTSDVITINIIVEGDGEIVHNMSLTLPALEQGQVSQAMLLELDRVMYKQILISVTSLVELTRILDMALITGSDVDLTDFKVEKVTCKRQGGSHDDTRVFSGNDCDNDVQNIIDNDTDTFWQGTKHDRLTIVFNQMVAISMIRFKQKYIKELSLFDDRECHKIHIRDDVPDNTTGWVLVQERFASNNISIRVDKSFGDKVYLYEIEIYGIAPTWTTIRPSSTSTTTTTTTTTTTETPTVTATPTTTTTWTAPPPTTISTINITTTVPPDTKPTTSQTSTVTYTVTSSDNVTTSSVVIVTDDDVNITETTVDKPTTIESTTTKITTPTTTAPPASTTPPANKLYYIVTMKIRDVTFDTKMGDNTSAVYNDTCALYVPLVVDAIIMTVEDRFLPPVYNVSYKEGSIDMTYTFEISGTSEINTATLTNNLLDVFNNSGILLDPNISVTPGQVDPEENKKLLLAGLVGALSCLVIVIVTAITIICVRHRCQRNESASEGDNKSDEGSVSAIGHYNVGNVTYPHGRSDRVWQRSETMTNQWHQNAMLTPPQYARGLAHLRPTSVSNPAIDGAFSYPEPRQPPLVLDRGFSMPEGRDLTSMDYFTDTVRPLPRFRRQQSSESHGTGYARDICARQDIQLDDVDPDALPGPSTSGEQYDLRTSTHMLSPDVIPPHMRNDSNSTDMTTFVLPKFYRDQDAETTYKGFFVSRDVQEDAFELPTCRPLGAAPGLSPGDVPRQVGLRRTDQEPDTLHPARPPFDPRASDSGSKSDDDILSMASLSGSSQVTEGHQYDSGYDDALKIYYADPKLDDRNFLQRLTETLGRHTGVRADIIHREPPSYLKQADSKRHTHSSTKSKSQKESRA